MIHMKILQIVLYEIKDKLHILKISTTSTDNVGTSNLLTFIDIVKLNGQSGDVEKTKETQKLIDAFTEVRNSRCVK